VRLRRQFRTPAQGSSCPGGGPAACFLSSMMRRSVLLVVSALALTLGASSSAQVVTPVLEVGQTRMFTAGQLAPGRTVVCAAGDERLRGNVPFVVLPGQEGVSVGRSSSGDGLTLSILVHTRDAVQAHDSYTVMCSRHAAPSSVCNMTIPVGQPPCHIPEFVPSASEPTDD
jgi:hypothetical protein